MKAFIIRSTICSFLRIQSLYIILHSLLKKWSQSISVSPPPLILLFVFIFPKVLVISRFLLEKKISLSFYDSCINCRKKLLSSTQNFGFYLSLQANCFSFTQETDYALSHDFISTYMVN